MRFFGNLIFTIIQLLSEYPAAIILHIIDHLNGQSIFLIQVLIQLILAIFKVVL